MKDFLPAENKRNHDAHRVFERFLHRAVGECEVIVAHHIVYMRKGSDDLPNEIPSADTLWFDPEMMGLVFGDKAQLMMLALAKHRPEIRDKTIGDFLDELDVQSPEKALKYPSGSVAKPLMGVVPA